MASKIGYQKVFTRIIVLLLPFVLGACENDLQKIKELTKRVTESDTDTSKVLEVIYSDSARVKFKLNAPLMLTYKGKDARNEAPNGIRLAIYDKLRKDSTIVTANYAVATVDNRIFTLKNNVVIKNSAGDIFKSEELVLNQITKKINSSKPSTILRHNGDFLTGSTCASDDDLSNPIFSNASATFHYPDSLAKH